jgi:hypothetical protein
MMVRFNYIKRGLNLVKPKIPMIVIAAFLILNAVMMIAIPVAFDKDYIEADMEDPTTEEGQVYEGLAAHNKAGLGAAMAALAIVLLMHINQPERAAKRVLLSVGIGMILVFSIVGLGGVRGFVDAPPLVPIIMGAIIGAVSIWVYNTPDEKIENEKLTDEEE